MDSLTPEEIIAYRIVDNRIAELAGWDQSIRTIEYQHLVDCNVEFDLEVTGFTMPEIDIHLNGSDEDGRAARSALCRMPNYLPDPLANCSEFIPPDWKLGVPGAPLPADYTLPEWQKFAVAESGQLEKANGRLGDTVYIFSTGERRTNESRPRKKWLGVM